MTSNRKESTTALVAVADTGLPTELYAQIQAVLQQARQQTKRSVNQVMVQAYWQVGRLIVEHEQAGAERAAYGAKTLQALATRLLNEFGKGFSAPNLRNFRQFFLTFKDSRKKRFATCQVAN